MTECFENLKGFIQTKFMQNKQRTKQKNTDKFKKLKKNVEIPKIIRIFQHSAS